VGAAGGLLIGGTVAGSRWLGTQSGTAAPAVVGPGSAIVAATEASRRSTGRIVRRELRAAPDRVDLGGRTVQAWAFDGTVPGPEIRVRPGDELRLRLSNGLPDPTTVHWHGLALRNDMDGVPGVTMDPVPGGASFEYAFIGPHSGTYWYHPHVGVQLDKGLQGALIVEDPDERGAYDEDVVLLLDDWTDGLGEAPTEVLARLGAEGMDMGAMDMAGLPSDEQPLGSDTGEVSYPAHLVNGRLPESPQTVRTSPGQRVRFRVINAGSDTAYRFAIGGHRLSVTHSDGFGVWPVEVDTLILGMGERYDVVVTVGDGAFPIVASPEGKSDPGGFAVLRSGSGATPRPGTSPVELRGQLLTYADLRPTGEVALPARRLDRELDMLLEMVDEGRRWYINGAAYEDTEPLLIRAGERVRVVMRNETMMFHPMHVHGHTFALADEAGPGARKDTVNVLPKQTLAVELEADNPGDWLVHCHNAYHGELGMMTRMSYPGLANSSPGVPGDPCALGRSAATGADAGGLTSLRSNPGCSPSRFAS